MAKDTVRVFIALEVAAAVQSRCRGLQEKLAPAGTSVKWVEPQNIHLTLKFLGQVERGKIQAVGRASDRAAGNAEPFELAFQGVGAFPNSRSPRIIWVGVQEGGEKAAAIAAELDRLLGREGFPEESRPFHPHLTLGRVRSHQGARRMGEALERVLSAGAGRSQAGSIIVFESRLSPRGSRYLRLHEAAIGNG